MKCSAIVAAGLAAVAAAAPAKVERSSFGFGNGINSFDAFNQDIAYLGIINGLNFDLFNSLALNNNFNFDLFNNNLFANNAVFDIQNLLLLQQLLDIQAFANVGVLSQFDFTGFTGFNNALDFGVTGLGSFGLNQFIPSSAFGNIQQIVSQQVTTFVAKE